MKKLFVSAITLSAVLPSMALAEMTCGDASLSYASRGDGESTDTTKLRLDLGLGFENGNLNYGFSGNYYQRNQDDSSSNTSGSIWVGYDVTEDLYLQLEYYTENSSDGDSYNYYKGLGEYSFNNTTVGLAYRKWKDDWTNVEVYGIYEPSDNLALGAEIRQYGFSGEESRDIAVVANYSAQNYSVSASGYMGLGDNEYSSIAVSGEYQVYEKLSILGGVGLRSYEGHGDSIREPIYGLGVGYDITDDLLIKAIYATQTSNIERHADSSGFGIALTWNFGKAKTAATRIDNIQGDVWQTINGYY